MHNPQIPLKTPQLIINHWFKNGLTHLTHIREIFDLSSAYASSLLSERHWFGILKDRGIDFNELLSSENKAVLEKLQTFDQLMRDKTNAIETFIKEQFLTYDDFDGEFRNGIKTIGMSMYKIVFESIHSSWTESMSVISVCKIFWMRLQSY